MDYLLFRREAEQDRLIALIEPEEVTIVDPAYFDVIALLTNSEPPYDEAALKLFWNSSYYLLVGVDTEGESETEVEPEAETEVEPEGEE